MWQELSRLYSGKSSKIITVLLSIIFLYLYITRWVLTVGLSLSWVLIHLVVISTLSYVAVDTLFPQVGEAIRRFYDDYGRRLSGLFSIVFFGWTVYLLLADSTNILFYVISIALGTTFLYNFINARK